MTIYNIMIVLVMELWDFYVDNPEMLNRVRLTTSGVCRKFASFETVQQGQF